MYIVTNMTTAGQRFDKHVPAAMNIRGINTRCYEGRFSTRRVFVTTDRKQTFSMDTGILLVWKQQRREERFSHTSVVREFNVQLWSVRQPAENGSRGSDRFVNQNQVSHRGREDTRSAVRNTASLSHWFWVVIVDCYCNRSAYKSNHPFQNPLLLVTEPLPSHVMKLPTTVEIMLWPCNKFT
jgi:hypothetical protein